MNLDAGQLRVVGGSDVERPTKRRRKKPRAEASPGGLRFAADGSLEAVIEGEWEIVCSPIRVVALTRDGSGHNWGRQIEIVDADGRRHRFAIDAGQITGRSDQVVEYLARRGLRLERGRAKKEALLGFLQRVHDVQGNELPRALAASRTGWHGEAFVLPSAVIGGSEAVAYQPTSAVSACIDHKGTLDAWRKSVALPAIGNSRLVLSLSLAFAAPLLGPLNYAEGFGVHFRGPSSVGKTKALEVAGSVWGGSDRSGYIQNWNATANGIEAMAEAHCDLLLCIDELGQVRPEDAGRVAYQLSAGTGKQRALSDGTGASRRAWQLIFLSSGEISLADKMREAKSPLRMMAGQAVRFIDLPADAGRGFGLFEAVPPIAARPASTEKERSRAFADALLASARANYGTAGPAFVAAFVEDRAGATELITSTMDALAEAMLRDCPGADGQVQRVARHLALAGAAGELAAQFKIVPWSRGEASNAAQICFAAWLGNRGTVGRLEIDSAIAHLREVIERDGSACFQAIDKPEAAIRDRLGYVRSKGDDTEYLVLPQAWERLMSGRDPRRTAYDLAEAGILRPELGKSGAIERPTQKARVEQGKNPQRVYVISHAALFADDDEEDEHV